MVDKPNERELRRFYQIARFQEELWVLAYETVWPSICRTVTKDRIGEPAERSPGHFATRQKIGA